MKQIAFILHGKIKKRDKCIAAIRSVFGNGYQLTFNVTQHADHAAGLAKDAVLNGATYIICMGGDGSLNEVINGIGLAWPQPAWGTDNVKVGLLPHGTGNDFARTMGVANNIAQLKKWIDEDSGRFIDLGYTEYKDGKGKTMSRYFVNITDVGIGGTIARRLSTSSKVMGPAITYQKAILTTLLTYKNNPVTAHADTFDCNEKMMSLIVANGKYFGGGMGIAPHASPFDKLFSIVVIGEVSMFEYLMNLGNIKKLKKIDHPRVKYLTASEILISSPDGPLPIDMDGEFIGYTPVKMKVVPAAIKFIGPGI